MSNFIIEIAIDVLYDYTSNSLETLITQKETYVY